MTCKGIGECRAITLTTGIDSLTGTAGNDTFNAPVTDGGTPTQTFGGLDSVDGGAGIDKLNIDFGTAVATVPVTATIKNIENLTVSTTNTAALVNGVDLDVTGLVGVQSVTVANGGSKASVVKGGETVSVTGGSAATVSGTALKNVTVSKAASATVSNDTAATVGAGATLTAVTLDNLTGAASTLTGAGIVEVSVKNQKVAHAVTVVNTVSTALTVNVDGAGYDAVGAAVAGVAVSAGAKAEAITVNATGSKSNVTVNAAAAKTLTLTGSAALKLAGVSGAALTSIDGSAATGGLDLGTLNVGTANVKTGSGNDKFTISATKVTVDSGAGNDTVTLASAIAAGSTINLGAGDDVLQFASGSVAANTTTATTVIDAGEGIDSVAAALINATNAKQFVNFERIDATAGSVTLDVDLMTGSSIGGLTLNSGSSTNTIQNLAVGAGLTVAGENTGSLTIGVKGAATNTADTFAITFAGQAASTATAAAPSTVSAASIGLQGVEAVTVASAGTGFVANSLSLAGNTELKTITITGDKALNLTLPVSLGAAGTDITFGGTATGKGVSLIDGSAATGKLTVDLFNVVTADTGAGVSDVILNIATGGLTIKGGSADDTIKVGAFSSTLTGGAGKDAFFVEKAVVLTATAAATAVKTTITDFAAGDTVDLSAAADVATTLAKVTLTSGVQNLDQALDLVGATTKTVSWFNYGADTYVVYNADATTGLDTGDVLVKLAGVIDLSNATISADGVLALA